MTTKEYQAMLLPKIQHLFFTQEIKSEWSAFTGLRHQYSPRVDIAVGPFNTTPGVSSVNEYNSILQNIITRTFFNQAFEFHVQNLDTNIYSEVIHSDFEEITQKNQNARCLIAIEIENKNSKKHIMGSLVNASSLGRVGIGVAYTDSTLKTFCRIANYLSFLKRVEKNTYDTTNFLILTALQLETIISQCDSIPR